MDRNTAGMYGSLLWAVGSAVGSVLGIYIAVVGFQASFRASAEAARTGAILSADALTESTISIFRPLQPILTLNGILLSLGLVLLLIGLDGLRRKTSGALGPAVLILGLVELAFQINSLGAGTFIGQESLIRNQFAGGFGATLVFGISVAVIALLFNILVGAFFLANRNTLPRPARAAGILFILGFIPFVLPVGSALLALLFYRLRRSPLPAGEAAGMEERRPAEGRDAGPPPAIPEASPPPPEEKSTGRGSGSRLHTLGLCGSLVLAVGSALTVALFIYTLVLGFQVGLQLAHQVAEANQSGHPLPRETIAKMAREAAQNAFGPIQPLLWTAAWVIWVAGIALLLAGLVGLRKRFPGALLPAVLALGLSTLIPGLGLLLGIVFNILLGVFLLVHRRALPGPALAAGVLFILAFIPFVGSAAFACLAGIFHRLRTA